MNKTASNVFKCMLLIMLLTGCLDGKQSVEDDLINQRQSALKILQREYNIENLDGLSRSHALIPELFFIADSPFERNPLCANTNCTSVDTSSICKNGFSPRAKTAERVLVQVACIPNSIEYAFKMDAPDGKGIEYCPDTNSWVSVFYGVVYMDNNSDVSVTYTCKFKSDIEKLVDR